MILYCVLSAFLNAAASLVLGVTVLAKNSRDARTVTFGFVTLIVSAWSAFYMFWQLAPDAATALAHVHRFSAAAIVIPILYFHFATKLTGREHRREVRIGYMLSLPFVPLSFTELIVTGVTPKMMFPFWPEPGVLYPIYLGIFFYYLLRSWHVLYSEFRQSSFLRRNQMRYVLAYTIVGFIGGATNFILWYDIPIPPVGNIFVGAYMVGVGYAVVRFRLIEFDLLAARVVVYSVLIAAIGAAMPLILEQLDVFPPSRAGFVPVYVVSVLLVAVLFWWIPVVRRSVDATLEQRVLGSRLSDRELLRTLAGRLSSAQTEPELFDKVIGGVTEALGTDDLAVYTRSEFETDFSCRASAGARRIPRAPFPDHSPLARALQERQSSILFDEIEHQSSGDARNYFADLRRKQGIELAVPIVGDTFFYGFLLLGPRKAQALYTDIDVSLLEAIGLQMGLNLRARQLERRASQTEKLIALGTLAAGLAHELRNPLTSVQTFSALMRESRPDPETLQEFSGVVQRDVARIASIVENVAAFAESNRVDMTQVNLFDVLRTVAEIVHAEVERSGTQLVLPPPIPVQIRGNHSQLLQVFLNLVQNALQAINGAPGSRIVVEIENHLPGSSSTLLCVTIADNGPGIDPALLPHIFEPFTTTKSTGERRGKHGMGLGLAIVKRIVQHHQGEIRASSTPGQGTVFRVFLPKNSSP
jgi:two-component system nitrogen regulation sensor histidine kinase GlnL